MVRFSHSPARPASEAKSQRCSARAGGLAMIAAMLVMAPAARAGARASANYSIAAETADSGGRRTTSANYTNDGSVGNVAGLSTVASPVETAKSGYVGQLYDVKNLVISAPQTTVASGATLALAAVQLMDDASTLPVNPTSVAWSVLSGPISSISTSGLATGGSVAQDTAATVQGIFAGLSGTLNLTVTAIAKLAQTITFNVIADQPFSTNPIALTATATSGLPVTFSVVSGPATVSGANLTLTGAGPVTARASQAGDATYAAAPEVDRSFTVAANFASWQQGKFTSGELGDAAVSGSHAVYGVDGYTNLVKYALGLDPKQDTVTGLPVISSDGTDWIFTYTRPSSVTDLAYTVEISTDLTSWTASGVTHELVSSVGGVETWRGRYPVSSTTRIFMRLQVTLP